MPEGNPPPQPQIPVAVPPKKRINWKIISIISVVVVIIFAAAIYTTITLDIFDSSSTTPSTSKDQKQEQETAKTPVKLKPANETQFEKSITGEEDWQAEMPQGIVMYTHDNGMMRISSREIKGIDRKYFDMFDGFLEKGEETKDPNLQSLNNLFPTFLGGEGAYIFVSEISGVIYNGVDKFRVVTVQTGMDWPGGLGVNIYARKGTDYIKIQSEKLLGTLNDRVLESCDYKAEDYMSYTAADYDRIDKCRAEKVSTDSGIVKELKTAAEKLSSLFRLAE